jgi:hypothetical protein
MQILNREHKGKMQIGRQRLGWKNKNKLISKSVNNADRRGLFQAMAQRLIRWNVATNCKSSTKFVDKLGG